MWFWLDPIIPYQHRSKTHQLTTATTKTYIAKPKYNIHIITTYQTTNTYYTCLLPNNNTLQTAKPENCATREPL